MQDAEIGIGKPIMIGLALGVALALIFASIGCGGQAHPSLASPPFARYLILSSGTEFTGNLTEIVQNDEGNVSGKCGLKLGDTSYDCAFVGLVQPDGSCALTFKVPSYSPFSFKGICGQRVIGEMNGSGFYQAPFAAARVGDSAWLDLYEQAKKSGSGTNEGMRPNTSSPEAGDDALPDFAMVSR